MTTAVIPRQQGDDYQARIFWLQASRLFQSHSKVVRVCFELDGVKSFDDVATFYDPAIQDEFGNSLSADHFQVKFHVDHAGAFTCEALTNPQFIGATKFSLLERLRDAVQLLAPDGTGRQFNVLAPWNIHPDDELAKLVSNRNGELRLQILFDGTTDQSAMGKIRKAWREHLGLADDTALRRVLAPLRIQTQGGTLEHLRDRLNDRLTLAGFRPVPAGGQGFPYDDLIRKLHAAGRTSFTREELREVCEGEGLWQGCQTETATACQIGVRSFLPWAEHMEDETDDMICLLRHFDGRRILETTRWQEAVLPGVRDFLARATRPQRPYHLHLDAHASIAFAAGYCLNTKSGVDVSPVQRTLAGKQVWLRCAAPLVPSTPLWTSQEIPCAAGGTDVAIAIGVTLGIVADVEAYVRRTLPAVGRILAVTPASGSGPQAVRGGAHAWNLACELATAIRQTRSPEERRGTLHLFAASPNALLFFLGQLAGGFGRCTLYEYDFATNAPAAYEPSLTIPPPEPGHCLAPTPVET